MHHKLQSYDVWFFRYGAWRTEFFAILDQFSHFCPPNNPKKSKFWKSEKNTWRYYHFTQMYQNSWHTLHCSWDTMPDRCNSYFLFWAILYSLTPITTQKLKISKKWKKRLEISSFYIRVTKIKITWCTVPVRQCATNGNKQTDGWKKLHTEVGAPSKNYSRHNGIHYIQTTSPPNWRHQFVHICI